MEKKDMAFILWTFRLKRILFDCIEWFFHWICEFNECTPCQWIRAETYSKTHWRNIVFNKNVSLNFHANLMLDFIFHIFDEMQLFSVVDSLIKIIQDGVLWVMRVAVPLNSTEN